MEEPRRTTSRYCPTLRLENIPAPSGKLESVDRKRFQGLVSEYYELRAWNKETGWPTKRKLIELGLVDVANALYASQLPSS